MAESFEVYVAEIGDGADPKVEWRLSYSGMGRETAFGVAKRQLDAGHAVRLQGKQVHD